MKSPRKELSSLLMVIASLVFTISTTTTAQSLNRCFVSLTIADQQGGAPANDLLSRDEYVTFVSLISTSFDASGGSFGGLTASLQQNFVSHAAGQEDQINIFGSKPGQNDVTEEQEVFLTELCGGTITAINALTAPTTAPVGPTSSTPRPTRPLNQCFVGMIIHDANPKNDLLDQNEYVRFLNFLEPDAFVGLTYSQLPLTMQSNYANLVDNNDDGIDVSGLPGPDPDQYSNLETICDITNTAISIAFNIPSNPPSPTIPATQPPIKIDPTTISPAGGGVGETTIFPTTSPTILTPSTLISRAPITFTPVAPVTFAPNALAPVTAAPSSSRPSKEPTTLPTLIPTTYPTSSPTTEAMNNETLDPVTMAPVTLAPVTRAPVAPASPTTSQATTTPTFPPSTTQEPPSSSGTIRFSSRGAAATIMVSLGLICFQLGY